MAVKHRHYPPPPYGLGSQFAETERPPSYATQLLNRFINAGGGAEARPGLRAVATAPANRRIDMIGDLVRAKGSTRMVVAARGRMFVFDHGTSAAAADVFVTAYDSFNSSLDYRPQAAQLDEKLIVVNENDRPIFTRTGRTYSELTPLIEQGNGLATATAHDKLEDTNIKSWTIDTDVATNDLVFDTNTSAYAIITNVGSAQLTHSPLTAASPGISSGNAAKAQTDHYEVLDLVELNIIPKRGVAQDPDNVAAAGAHTDASNVFVSASGVQSSAKFLNWQLTDIRVGDWLYNSTRNQPARVKSITSSAVRTTDVAGQVPGDSLTFHKFAMPIAAGVHVHYNRAYYIDARARHLIRISGPNDPRDMTTFAGTLDATSFRAGAQQPEGDEVLAMQTFQGNLLLGGRRHIYLFSGINPIADASGDVSDFKPQSMFPLGLVGPHALAPTGNDIVFLTPDGLNAASIPYSNVIPTREIMSQAIRDELIREVAGASADATHVVHYPRRSWVIVRASTRAYIFNYATNLKNAAQAPAQRGSWSTFTGALAAQRTYFVRGTGTLWTGDANGVLWKFDVAGAQTDSGASGAFTMRAQSAWLGLDEGAAGGAQPSRKRKAGVAILPQFQLPAGHNGTTYTVAISAPYEEAGGETLRASVGTAAVCGQGAFTPRLPARWSGERVRVLIENTAVSAPGPDVLTGFTLAFNERGVR